MGEFGAKGLAYIKVENASKGTDGLRSPILKFLPLEAVQNVLDEGLRTKDIMSKNMKEVSTSQMGEAVINQLK